MEKIEEYQKIKERRNKRFLLAFIGSICLILGILFFMATSYLMELLLLSNRMLIIVGAILFIGGLSLLFSVYLGLRPIGFYPRFNPYEDSDLNSILNYHLKKNFIDKYGSQYFRYNEKDDKPSLFM